jgi:hypothetical protein
MNTASENKISEAVRYFAPITLAEMDSVQLMSRIDSKYVFNIEKLPLLLNLANNDFRMVEIAGYREQLYETTYFDTPDYNMYLWHHNGKSSRYKIRVRRYVYSRQQFLEVKRKTNKGETIKNRIATDTAINNIVSEKSYAFLSKFTPYTPDMLIPVLGNKFIRLTLVNKNFKERITLDYNLRFIDLKGGTECFHDGLCIAEVKRSRDDRKSKFMNLVSQLNIEPMGFSKYSVGMAMLSDEVKTNLFKPKLRAISKIVEK